MLEFNLEQQKEINSLVELIKKLNVEGHNPATSGNYSLKINDEYALVSESGIDKAHFEAKNFLPVQIQNAKLHPEIAAQGRKSSDETAIHITLYQEKLAGCVLHTHMLETLLFADQFLDQNVITLTGLEMLKAFQGIKTHEAKVRIPVFANSQDIESLAKEIIPVLRTTTSVFGIILRGHGMYVWGNSVFTAKRHLEAFEYLFKYHLKRKTL